MDRIISMLPKYVGDIFNVIPSIELIRKSYPNAKIHLFGLDAVAELFSRRLDKIYDVKFSMQGSRSRRILRTIKN